MKRFLGILLLSNLFIPQTLAATGYQEGYYTAKVTANIRAQAGMQGKQIGYIAANDELYVRGQKGQWCDVEYRTYEHAYVLCSLLEEQTYATNSDDYYDQGDYYDSYDTLPLPSDTTNPLSTTTQRPKACDITTTTCSGDFKVGVTADLTSTNSFDGFRTLKLNLHGQGRMNVKDTKQPELSLTVNGSFQSDMGSAQGSAEMVLKDKGYVRLNDLQSMNIPGMSADMIKEIQTTMLNKWFTLPSSNTSFLSSAPLLMNSNDDIQGLVAMSKFMGTDVNGADTRYHYQLDLDEKKMNWMMDGGSDEQHLTGNQSTASINYWLDSTQRLVSGSATLKIVPTATDSAAGTITITFDSSNLNQDIHVTVPENAEPLPKSLPQESALMLL